MSFLKLLAFVLLLVIPAVAGADDIDRPGVGDWCYDPVRTPSQSEKIVFVEEVSFAAIEGERKWGVPAPIIAAMAIVESGYGTTRLAIKANNILAFKWPGDEIAGGLKKFVLWCQPKRDKGNEYPAFGSRAEAIDFVAWRLKLSKYYSSATAAYTRNLANRLDRKAAGRNWLKAIAPSYNWEPEVYIQNVVRMADDPFGDQSRTLWSLEP
jgi:hypothetical protein